MERDQVSGAEVSDLIAALRSGALSLEEVAQEFREKAWARARRPEPQSYRDRAAQLDPPPHVAGSIDDLTAAYDRGELTWEQYRTLADAVADAINAQYEVQDRGTGTSIPE